MVAEKGEYNPGKWAWDRNTWTGVAIGGVAGGVSGALVGGMWAAGATVSIGANIGGNTIPLIAFSKAGFATANTVAGVIGIGGAGAIAGSSINWSMVNVSSQDVANVYIETDGVGHAYLEVKGTVFSYGRYNGSYSPSSGAFGPVGEGVLYKKTGDAATKFIIDRTAKYPTKQYSYNVDATATYNYFNNAYNAGAYNTVDSRVIDTYYLLGNNCTTVVCGGLRAGGSGIPIIQTPAGFENFMYNVNRMQNGWNPGAVVPWEPKY